MGTKFAELSEAEQQNYAKLMDGEVVYIKMEAVYSGLPKGQRLCIKRRCWQLADIKNESDYCVSHTKKD